MTGTRWIRIFLVGLPTGIAWYGLSSLLLSLFAQPFLAWARAAGSAAPARGSLFFAIDLAMGVWAVWLYSTLSAGPRSRAGAAVTTGLAWWIIKSLQSAKWAGLGLIPKQLVLAPLSTTFAAAILASGIGAWLYDGRAPWRREHVGS